MCIISSTRLISQQYNTNIRPCLATMTLAIASGTLVPAAKNVMPIILSGMSNVNPINVTLSKRDYIFNKKNYRITEDTPMRGKSAGYNSQCKIPWATILICCGLAHLKETITPIC